MTVSPQAILLLTEQFEAGKQEIEVLAAESRRRGEHPEWPWSGFVLSYATLGGSANWEKRKAAAYNDYSWQTLSRMSDQERRDRLLTLGNPRFRRKVGQWAALAFDEIDKMGGPIAARNHYQALDTADARIAFIQSFPGFGPKYARNIPMDIYDPLVTDRFALDHRLNTILDLLGVTNRNYKIREAILIKVARDVGINAWQLDRLLYSRFDAIKTALTHLKKEK